MSYEYSLIFDDPSLTQHVLNLLKVSDACVEATENEVRLKEPGLNSLENYDVRFVKKGEKSLWLEVNFKSPNLYRLLQEILRGRNFICFEDGDEDSKVELLEAFRIKGSF